MPVVVLSPLMAPAIIHKISAFQKLSFLVVDSLKNWNLKRKNLLLCYGLFQKLESELTCSYPKGNQS
jgi:hypothetical protein